MTPVALIFTSYDVLACRSMLVLPEILHAGWFVGKILDPPGEVTACAGRRASVSRIPNKPRGQKTG